MFFVKKNIELQRRLELFCTSLKDSLDRQDFKKSINALYLVGSYGRGEGLISFEKNLNFVNDIDILLIHSMFSGKKVQDWAVKEVEKGEQSLGIEVTISPLFYGRARYGSKQLLYYDLFNASYVIYETPKALALKSRFSDLKTIPDYEVYRLIFNRQFGLIVELFENYKNSQNTDIATNKLFLALASAHLIRKKVYDPKISNWPSLKSSFKDLNDFIQEGVFRAIDERISSEKVSNSEPSFQEYMRLYQVSYEYLLSCVDESKSVEDVVMSSLKGKADCIFLILKLIGLKKGYHTKPELLGRFLSFMNDLKKEKALDEKVFHKYIKEYEYLKSYWEMNF